VVVASVVPPAPLVEDDEPQPAATAATARVTRPKPVNTDFLTCNNLLA